MVRVHPRHPADRVERLPEIQFQDKRRDLTNMAGLNELSSISKIVRNLTPTDEAGLIQRDQIGDMGLEARSEHTAQDLKGTPLERDGPKPPPPSWAAERCRLGSGAEDFGLGIHEAGDLRPGHGPDRRRRANAALQYHRGGRPPRARQTAQYPLLRLGADPLQLPGDPPDRVVELVTGTIPDLGHQGHECRVQAPGSLETEDLGGRHAR